MIFAGDWIALFRGFKFISLFTNKPGADIDYSGIIQAAFMSIDFIQRLIDPQRFPVWPVGRHRLDNIRHRQNPGFQADAFAF